MDKAQPVVLISLINSTDNLGLKYVHSSLLAKGYQSLILFHTSEDEPNFELVADFVKDRGASVVGISLMSRLFHAAVNLTKAIRNRSGDRIPIIWGGIHPTIDPESCRDYADYLCVGEGEIALPEFLENLNGHSSTPETAGITSRQAGSSPTSARVDDLDSLAFPEFLPRNAWVTDRGKIAPLDGPLLKRHTRHQATYLPVLTSRGCPFACAYCCNNLMHKIYGKKIRKRSPENVVAEIDRNLSRSPVKFNYVSVYDDCFTAHSSEWLETFVRHYKNIAIPLVFRAIPQFVTKEKISILKEAPCGFALIGLQSGSERTLTQVYKRKHSKEAFSNCARLLSENKIPAVYDVIVENPYETDDDIRRTVETVAELPKTSYVSMSSLTFYKYTELYDRAKSEGYPVDEHLTKNQDAWSKTGKEAQAIRIAALLNKNAALQALDNGNGTNTLPSIALRLITLKLLEPLRYLKLMYLSHGGKKLAFLRLLLPHARDYGKRYFSVSCTNKHEH